MEKMLRTPAEGLRASKKMTASNILDKMSVNTIKQYRGAWIVKTEEETFILVKEPTGMVKITTEALMAMECQEYYRIVLMLVKGASCEVYIDEHLKSVLKDGSYNTVPMYVQNAIKNGRVKLIDDSKALHFVIDFTDSDLHTEDAVSIYGPFTYFKEAKKYMASISDILDKDKEDIYDYTTTRHLYRIDDFNCRSLRVVTLNVGLKLEPEFALVRYSCGVTSTAQNIGIVGVYNTEDEANKFKAKYALNNDFGYSDVKEFKDNGYTATDVLCVTRIYGAQEI